MAWPYCNKQGESLLRWLTKVRFCLHSPRRAAKDRSHGGGGTPGFPQTVYQQSERGFTLLEVMIALVIVGTALTGLIGLAQRQIQSSEAIQRTTQATLLAQGILARLEVGEPPQEGGSEDSGVFPAPQDTYRWQVERRPSPLPGVQEITVTVAWGEEARSEAVALVSFLR